MGFSCEFLTGKELDPDFLDFNSVNRRYHFPARFYLPMRAVFGLVDPLFRGPWYQFNQTYRYQYVSGMPVVQVDPTGAVAVRIVGDVKQAAANIRGITSGGAADGEFSYWFQVQYDAGKDNARGFVLAHVSTEIVLQDEDSCKFNTDTVAFDEWFRLDADGTTPTTAIPYTTRRGEQRKGPVDIHSVDLSGTKTCWGRVRTIVTYGIAEGITDATSWYGVGNPANSTVSRLGLNFPNSGDVFVVQKNAKIKGTPEKWHYQYAFQKKGDCCSCIENVPMDSIDINGKQVEKPTKK